MIDTSVSNIVKPPSENMKSVMTMPSIKPEITSTGVAIRIDIHVDAKDQESFANVLKFIKDLKSSSDIEVSEINLEKTN